MEQAQLKQLVDSLFEQSRTTDSVAVCIGPDVARASGIPAITEIAMRLFEELSEAGQLDVPKKDLRDLLVSLGPSDLLALITESLDIENLVEYIKDLSQKARPSKLHKSIARIPARTYITTNYDELLEAAFRDSQIKFDVIASGADFLKTQIGASSIVKLNGSIDRPWSMFKSENIRIEHEEDQHTLDQYMRAVFASSLVLFVGFDLQDRGFLEIYEKYGGGTQIPTDWVVVAPPGNLLTRKLWTARGPRVVELDLEETEKFLNLLGQRLRRSHAQSRLKPSRGRRILLSGDLEAIETIEHIARAVSDAGFQPVVWWKVSATGLAVFEKMEQVLTDVAAAVVMIASDASFVSANRNSRSIQNVIFEIGLLAGRLGRDRVMVLVNKGAADLPSALPGIQFAITDTLHRELTTQSILHWLDSLDG